MYLKRIYLFPALPALLLVCVICLGCATPPVVPSGFLSDYDSLRLHEDSTLYSSDSPEKGSTKTHIIFLRDTQLWADAGMDPELRSKLCQVFTSRLRMRMLQYASKGDILVLETESQANAYRGMPGVGILTVSSALTHIEEGLGVTRYLVGFGLGDARVTVEVKAKLVADGAGESREMVVFARSHGNPHGGMNPRSLFTLYSLRLACDSAAEKVAKQIFDNIVMPEVRWWDRSSTDLANNQLIMP